MRKHKPDTFTKYLFTLTLFLSLLFNLVPNVRACGPYQTETLFSYDVRPENLQEFATGNIGILRPRFARSYLVVAYRFMNDLPLSKKEQKQVVELWNYRLGINDSKEDGNEVDMPTALENWSKLRNRVLNINEETITQNNIWKDITQNNIWKDDVNDYSSYVNCTKSGFETAAKTLESRLAKYPDQTENLKEWVNGQHAVFSNCSKVGEEPKNVAEDSPHWLKKDRDYQIAAATFYAGKFDIALTKFEKIAKDDSSEWNKISNYLIARTYLRKASLQTKNTKEFNKKAESHLLNLIKDETMQEVHGISQELLYITENRLKTEERFHKISEKLSNQTEFANLRSEVQIYTNYLDNFGFKPDEKAIVIDSNAKTFEKNELVAKAEPTFWQWLWTWLFGEETKIETKRTDTKPAFNETNEPGNDDYDHDYDYERPKLKNSMHFASEIEFEHITEIALLEDISAWIFAMQSNDEKAYKFALEKWQKTSKTHWLAAAISNAEIEYDGAKELIEKADSIKFSSPAFSTVKYHQVRLLIELDKFDEARNKLDEFLKKSNTLPLSTQNSFSSQRMLVAKDLDEFLTFAQRKTIAYSSYSSFQDETSEIGSYGELDTRDRGMLEWRNRWMFDEDSIEIFNKKMPLKMLMQAGLQQNVPKYLRKGILISALTRAILLKNKTAERKIANDLINLAPEMANNLLAFSQNPNDLNTFKLLVTYPLMQPLVDKGFGRFIIPADSLAYDRDNWWYQEELEIKKEYLGEPINPKFLSENDLKLAENERKQLFERGHAGEILSEKALSAAKNFPNEKTLSKLLYKTLQANRYGDNGGDTRKNTRTVFQTLHRRFPKSVWAEKSPIWY